MHYMNESYELAMKLCGLDPDNDDHFDEAEDTIEETLWDKYEITSENFEKLINDLLPYTHMAQSGFDPNRMLVGFADHQKGVFLLKKEAKEEDLS